MARRFRCLIAMIFALGICFCKIPVARADIWGADVAVLAQILQQTILQLAELKAILQSGNDTLGLLQEVNRGINDSLHMAETLGIRVDPGLYRELHKVDVAVKFVQDVYGKPVDSPIASLQQNTDQTVAEAFSFNNELNDYATKLDRIGEDIKNFSHQTSPGGAAKLTAESMGVLIHVANQQLRATGQGLKLQAQVMAMNNKQDKDHVAQYLKEGALLKEHLSSINPSFEVPRF